MNGIAIMNYKRICDKIKKYQKSIAKNVIIEIYYICSFVNNFKNMIFYGFCLTL